MNYNLEIDLIINRKTYPKIYNFTYVLLVVLLITIYIIFTYKYQTYYFLKGRMINNEIELLVPISEVEIIQNNHNLIINNTRYNYKITDISKELYLDNDFQNYCYLYLKIDNLSNIDNFVYNLKIPKENKILAKYLKDYM